jgi:hypothetical protein
MSGQRRGSASPAVGSELEEAWKRHCKYSAAGSRCAACKYSAATMPPSLRDFAEGGPYYKADPPLKPMSGADFEKWRSRWEQEQEQEAEAEEAVAAIAAVNELIAREAAATTPVVNIDD